MSEWISVKDHLPDLLELVWIYWRDREVDLGCRTDAHYDLHNQPSWGWYSFQDQKGGWAHWWQPIKVNINFKPEKWCECLFPYRPCAPKE